MPLFRQVDSEKWEQEERLKGVDNVQFEEEKTGMVVVIQDLGTVKKMSFTLN